MEIEKSGEHATGRGCPRAGNREALESSSGVSDTTSPISGWEAPNGQAFFHRQQKAVFSKVQNTYELLGAVPKHKDQKF